VLRKLSTVASVRTWWGKYFGWTKVSIEFLRAGTLEIVGVYQWVSGIAHPFKAHYEKWRIKIFPRRSEQRASLGRGVMGAWAAPPPLFLFVSLIMFWTSFQKWNENRANSKSFRKIIYDTLRTRVPYAFFVTVLLFNFFLRGLVPVQASDINHTLAVLSLRKMNPGTVSSVQESLPLGPFYAITSDPINNLEEFFIGAIQKAVRQNQLNNFTVVTTGGLDIHRFKEGQLTTETLRPGISEEHQKIVERILNEIKLEDDLYPYENFDSAYLKRKKGF